MIKREDGGGGGKKENLTTGISNCKETEGGNVGEGIKDRFEPFPLYPHYKGR